STIRIGAWPFDLWHGRGISRKTALHGGDDVGAPFRAIKAFWNRTQAAEPLDGGGCVGRYIADRVILENAAARNVTALRLLFAPSRDFNQHRKLFRFAHARF